MGDLVSADRTFLDHLSNKQYIVSAECRLAENFLTAMKNRDLDMVNVFEYFFIYLYIYLFFISLSYFFSWTYCYALLTTLWSEFDLFLSHLFSFFSQLEEAHKDPQLSYLDREVQQAAKRLSLFSSKNTIASKTEKEVNAPKKIIKFLPNSFYCEYLPLCLVFYKR